MLKSSGNLTLTTAVIGALTTVLVGGFTAYATSSARVNQIDTQVQVLQERQELQYNELKGLITEQGVDIKQVLKAVK